MHGINIQINGFHIINAWFNPSRILCALASQIFVCGNNGGKAVWSHQILEDLQGQCLDERPLWMCLQKEVFASHFPESPLLRVTINGLQLVRFFTHNANQSNLDRNMHTLVSGNHQFYTPTMHSMWAWFWSQYTNCSQFKVQHWFS